MKNYPGFKLFAAYNLLLFLMQMAFIGATASLFFHREILPFTTYLEQILAVLTQIFLYFLFTLLQSFMFWGIKNYRVNLERWHISIWSISIIAMLSSNAYFFPSSSLSRIFFSLFPIDFLLLIMRVSLGINGLLLLNALFLFFWRHMKLASSFILLSTGLFVSYSMLNKNQGVLVQQKTNKQTNIILIGIDSLSPTRINPNLTPHLQKFLQESVSFHEVVTPLARTYPAWISILTGLYPVHHGARYNLTPKSQILSSQSIAWGFQQLGYKTILATDERRFNPMDKEFGFQQIIGPKIGANDFLIGAFNDFPLGNFLINSSIGRWLFPYNHTNRASFFSYYPQSFDNEITRALEKIPAAQPVFLAVHFTLPHTPYAWAASTSLDVRDSLDIYGREKPYLEAVHRVDQQVADFLKTLEKKGYFENSIIVLLSDHGESFYKNGSRQTLLRNYQGTPPLEFAKYLDRKTNTELEKSTGHGSDLLSPDQFHCLLAFKIYKQHQLISSAKIIKTRVALIDIAPTLESLVQPHAWPAVDGISLSNAILHPNAALPKRSFLMESGMLSNQILTFDRARQLGAELFGVHHKNAELYLRRSKIVQLDKEKLYAIIKGHWLLALYPDDKGYLPILLQLKTGQWVDDLNTDFAKSSPAEPMLAELRQFYSHKTWQLVPEAAH